MAKLPLSKKAPSAAKKPLVGKQPQSKREAAAKNGKFLHADSVWSNAYFDSNDLHFRERELLG